MLALYHLSFCDLPLLCLFAKKVLYTKFPHYEEIKQNFLCSNLTASPLPSSLIITTTTYVHLLIILWWDILLLLDVTRIFAQFLRNENKLMERINVMWSSNFVWIFGLDFWILKLAIVGNTDKFCLTQSLFIAIPHPFISSANCSFLLPILQITSQPFSLAVASKHHVSRAWIREGNPTFNSKSFLVLTHVCNMFVAITRPPKLQSWKCVRPLGVLIFHVKIVLLVNCQRSQHYLFWKP